MKISAVLEIFKEQQKRFAPDPKPTLVDTFPELKIFSERITDLSRNSQSLSVIDTFFSVVQMWRGNRLLKLENDFRAANYASRYNSIIADISYIRMRVDETFTNRWISWRPQAEMINAADAIYLGGVSGLVQKSLSEWREKEKDPAVLGTLLSQASCFMEIHALLISQSIRHLQTDCDLYLPH